MSPEERGAKALEIAVSVEREMRKVPSRRNVNLMAQAVRAIKNLGGEDAPAKLLLPATLKFVESHPHLMAPRQQRSANQVYAPRRHQGRRRVRGGAAR